MREIVLFIILIYCPSFCSLAQSDITTADTSYYIRLKNGKTIQAKSIELQSIPNKKPYIEVDEKEKYTFDQVSYYKNGDGFFRQWQNRWLKLEKAGKINLYSYSYTSVRSSGGGMTGMKQGYDGMSHPTYSPKTRTTHNVKVELIQVGEDPPTSISYRKIKKHTYNDPLSMTYLKKGRTLATIRGVSMLSGIGLSLAGLFGFIGKEESSVLKYSMIGGGAALSTFSLYFIKPEKNYRRAIDIYNR